MKKVSSLNKIIFLLAILVVPSLAYLYMLTGKNQFKHLQYFGPKDEVDAKGDTLYFTVPDYSFTNQKGDLISSDKELKIKIYVASLFFASCNATCPKISMQLQRVQEKFKAQLDVRLVSITVDPERDSVKALEAYGRKFLINPVKWYLLTGDKKKIYELAKNGFLANASEGTAETEDFIHTQNVLLIDKEKRIRGIYDGTDPKEVDRLMDEMTVLLTEYKTRK